MKKHVFIAVAVYLLVALMATSCDPNGTDDPIGITQQKPRRPGQNTEEPRIERWQLTQAIASTCWDVQNYPYDYPYKLELNWTDSTYTVYIPTLHGYEVVEHSGRFHFNYYENDTTLSPELCRYSQFTFDKPVFWSRPIYTWSVMYAGDYSSYPTFLLHPYYDIYYYLEQHHFPYRQFMLLDPEAVPDLNKSTLCRLYFIKIDN